MRFSEFANPSNCQVVGFRAAGGEDNLVGAHADQTGDLAPRTVGSRARLLTEEMDTRGVAKLFRQIRQHRLDDPAIDWRGGTVIEIDFAHRSVLRGLFRGGLLPAGLQS